MSSVVPPVLPMHRSAFWGFWEAANQGRGVCGAFVPDRKGSGTLSTALLSLRWAELLGGGAVVLPKQAPRAGPASAAGMGQLPLL